jgi:hypothetical protein
MTISWNQPNNNEECTLYRESKSLRAGVQHLGCVQVKLRNFLENDSIEPGSRLNVSLDITNSSKKVKFDEIRISVNEVQTWASLIQPKHGNNATMTEITKLSKKCLQTWDIEKVVNEQTGKTERFVQLHGMSAEIPKITAEDRPYGLLRIHHYLQVKLISDGKIINNLRFRFPLVIGGPQMKELSDDHPLHTIKKHKRNLSKALAFGVARTIILVTQAFDYAFEKPVKTSKKATDMDGRPLLAREARNVYIETLVSTASEEDHFSNNDNAITAN